VVGMGVGKMRETIWAGEIAARQIGRARHLRSWRGIEGKSMGDGNLYRYIWKRKERHFDFSLRVA
jgi:hypothetical protein